VARHQHRPAPLRLLAQQQTHPADAGRVEPVGRLVEDEHLRIAEQRGGDRQPLAHSHGVALDPAVGGVGEPDAGQHLRDPLDRMPAGGGHHAEVVARRAAGVEGRVLEHRAHLAAGPLELLIAVTAEGRGARGRVDQPEQRPQRGALAGAVGAQEAGHAPGLDIEAEPLDRLHGAEALVEVADLGGGHRGGCSQAGRPPALLGECG